MDKKYQIGIIGYGGFGQFLHYWWSKLDNVQVRTVADPRHGDKAANYIVYDNWKALVDDPEIDIVSIVTPPALHAEMACAAMRAGKHVLLEKPVALNLEEAQQILTVQQETGKIITVDHTIRYNPIIQSLMVLTQHGAFGKLRHVAVNNYAQDEGLPPEHWFWKDELSGGILVEHGVHFFDIVNGLSGQSYQDVCGASDRRNSSQRDRMAALVLYDQGLIASYYHAFSGPGLFEETTVELTYDLARLEIKGWMPMEGRVKALVNANTKKLLETIPGWQKATSQTLQELNDVSRPEGWGEVPASTADMTSVRCGGVMFEASEVVTGTFAIGQTKGQVYGRCVQDILTDLTRKAENPTHQLDVTLDAVEALKIAVLASR